MTKRRLCIINVVGLTPKLLEHAPNIKALGRCQSWTAPWPAVTCTSQATMLTGRSPREHGIVGNGWYFRDTAEIRFWQQHNGLIQSPKFYEGIETAKMFWWFNQNADVRYSCTPKPYYGSDGSKVFAVLDRTGCQLTERIGEFPFHAFWGPKSGLASSRWIADATALTMREKKPPLTLAYLPHLDYDLQRSSSHSSTTVAEADNCAAKIIAAANEIDAEVLVVSEYGLVPVNHSVSLNRTLRSAGMLEVRDGPYGETLLPGESTAFAVCDHQLAHVYVRSSENKLAVKNVLEALDGVSAVVDPRELNLDHPRSGELIALAEPNAWFNYYYWIDDARAPDFAKCVDIHRKPGYDPCELFLTSNGRAAMRLAQKKLGLRYRMDVIPLDPSLVGGSHGLRPSAENGPIAVGQKPPDKMEDLYQFVREFFSLD